MASIYEISDYEVTSYTANDIIHCGNCLNPTSAPNGRFYYNLGNGNGARPEASGGETYWGGYTTYNNKTVPHFFWIPSYTASVSTEPQVDVIKFGDGYEQRTPQNISSELIKISLSFDKRDEKEVSAIAHFLHTRGAQEAFAFTPPSPYGSVKLFVCRSWDVTMNFKDNFSVKATFEEVVE